MRIAFYVFAILVAVTIVTSAEDDKSRRQKEKPIQLPSFEFNGYSGRLSADQSRIWDAPDPSSQFQVRQSGSQPYFGLTLSRSLQ